MRRSILVFCSLLIMGPMLYADPVDSLENVLKTAKGDLKVKTLNELFRAYFNSDPIRAIGYTREALSLASEIDDRKGMAASYNNLITSLHLPVNCSAVYGPPALVSIRQCNLFTSAAPPTRKLCPC